MQEDNSLFLPLFLPCEQRVLKVVDYVASGYTVTYFQTAVLLDEKEKGGMDFW